MTLIQTFELIRDFSPINVTTYICNSFYRATRVHSADYAVARCPSVRHTPVLSLNGYTYPQFFSPSGSPAILVSRTKRDGNIPTAAPPNGATNTRG